jgi:hypothetical protein
MFTPTFSSHTASGPRLCSAQSRRRRRADESIQISVRRETTRRSDQAKEHEKTIDEHAPKRESSSLLHGASPHHSYSGTTSALGLPTPTKRGSSGSSIPYSRPPSMESFIKSQIPVNNT